MTYDTWHETCDMWHVTRDTWHVTHDTWHMTRLGGGVNILSKFQLPSSYRLWFYDIMKIWRKGMSDRMNQSVTRLFIEQPRLHRVCLKASMDPNTAWLRPLQKISMGQVCYKLLKIHNYTILNQMFRLFSLGKIVCTDFCWYNILVWYYHLPFLVILKHKWSILYLHHHQLSLSFSISSDPSPQLGHQFMWKGLLCQTNWFLYYQHF